MHLKYDKIGRLIEVTTDNKTAKQTYEKTGQIKTLTDSNDSRNRLTQADGTTYGYDSQNHRIWQKEGNKQTKYIINPNSSLSQLLQKIDPDGTTTNYIYGLGLIYQEQNGKRLYYHYDLRGSTIALTDQNGKVVDRWSYLPYGAKISHSLGNTKTPFLYNGRDGVQTDSNGLYYMRARYYQPTIRRFINRDTLLGEIGNLPTLNRFAYVNGDPVSGVDPSGLTPKEDENIDKYIKNMNEYFLDKYLDKYIKNLLESDAKVWGNASKKQWRIFGRKTHLFLRKNYDRVTASVDVFKKSYEASTLKNPYPITE